MSNIRFFSTEIIRKFNQGIKYDDCFVNPYNISELTSDNIPLELIENPPILGKEWPYISVHSIESDGRVTTKPSSPSNNSSSGSDGSVANSPMEEFNVFDTMCSILMCTKVLIFIAFIVILVAVITAYIVSSGHKFQGKSKYTTVNRFTSYIIKAGYFYSIIFTGLAGFNLIWSLYFINKLIEMVTILSGK